MAKFQLRDRVKRAGREEVRTVQQIRENPGVENLYYVQLGNDTAASEWAKESELELADFETKGEFALNQATSSIGPATKKGVVKSGGIAAADSVASAAEFARNVLAVLGNAEGDVGTDDRRFERLAIEEARKSAPEDERVHPKVGVVVVKDGRVLATAHRGEIPQCHAEYIALENKLPKEPLSGTTVYTTLEPCTSRNHPKVPCAARLAERKVARVVIGMLDPDDRISGGGFRALRKAGIDTGMFPTELMAEVEELNRDFIRVRETARAPVLLTGEGTNESGEHEPKPELLIDFEDGPSNIVPAEHKRGDKLASMIYVRVRVQNKGSAIAKGCRVYLTELKEVSPGGTAATALDDSKVLAWAGYHFSPLDIPPEGVFYADVVRFSKDDRGWLFSVEKLLAHQQKLKDYVGTYRFRVMVVAENAARSFCEFDVTYNGDWHSLQAMPGNPQ